MTFPKGFFGGTNFTDQLKTFAFSSESSSGSFSQLLSLEVSLVIFKCFSITGKDRKFPLHPLKAKTGMLFLSPSTHKPEETQRNCEVSSKISSAGSAASTVDCEQPVTGRQSLQQSSCQPTTYCNSLLLVGSVVPAQSWSHLWERGEEVGDDFWRRGLPTALHL